MSIEKVGVIDYGSGNILSVANALKAVGAEVYVGRDIQELRNCYRYILPGVGAYADCMKKIQLHRIDEFINTLLNTQKPILGICVGMQVMGSSGEEFGAHAGLSLVKGKVVQMRQLGLQHAERLPNIGWRNVTMFDQRFSWLVDGLKCTNKFYFFHSYSFENNLPITIAEARYGDINYPAIIASNNIIGVQFHPEKSGAAGLQLLSNFINWSA